MSDADDPPPPAAAACAEEVKEATAMAASAASATRNETADRMTDRVKEARGVYMAVSFFMR
ncbi:hypothetical protein MA3A0930S_4935 [Mycobacteroides abscessus 3A-0930-S]|nr:hypothetical protein MA3A0930S_4935 [Mycobacteroides abscessus 3A-0930-S]